MAKGFFTQCVCLLTDGQTTIAHVKAALEARRVSVVKEAPAAQDVWFGGPSLLVPFRPEANGYVNIDVVDAAWPDHMGDPKTETMLFGAWSMGHLGPHAFPGGLARAAQHAWAWEPGKRVAAAHKGFIRIRLSYVFGASGKASVYPDDCDPVAELTSLSKLVLALFDAPGVLCYFNPNGEVLLGRDGFVETFHGAHAAGKLPLQLWSNVRVFRISDDFGFMDTVGAAQLDLPDVEAAFPASEYEPGAVDYYLRNVTIYLLESGKQIGDDEPIDGPDETDLGWSTKSLENGLIDPPRPVLRLFPARHADAIGDALAAVEGS